MCGIAGIFGASDEKLARTMAETLVHRGPDDGHVVSGRGFALAARRLAIIDLEGGRQPLSNEAGDVWVAQNGEIYNFRSLREDLVRAGHRFSTRCDTEVLVHAYEEWGVDFLDRLEGMFAIALWDETRQRGLLARDRLGKKPLYWTSREGRVLFGSELKALLVVPGFERRLDLASLHHFLSLKHVPSPRTIFEDVHMLPPGHRLLVEADGSVRAQRWWRLDFGHPLSGDELREEALVDGLLDRLRKAVERRMVADVPVGFFLSGGIDSGLVTALAAEISAEPLRTFTLVYGDSSTTAGKEDDRRWAREIARKTGSKHLEERLDAGNLPDELPRILRHFDEPFAGVFSSFFLSRLISQHVKVCMSGDGADELFGSYLSHRLAHPIASFVDARDRGDGAPEGLLPFEGREGFLESIAERETWRWRSKLLVFREAEKRALYAPEIAKRLASCSTEDLLRADFADLTADEPLNRMLEAELGHLFPDQVLCYADRLSMAHSLEVRSPFLDSDFVSYVARIPGSWKIRQGVTKYLLKRAALRYLPPGMVHRPKEGFLMPVTQWILGDLEAYVRDMLAPARLRRHGIFEADAVGQLVDRLYKERSSDYTVVNQVLNLIVFQQWHDLYLGA